MISRSVSLRLTVIRFPLIVGVVFIHSYSTFVTLGTGGIAGAAHADPVTAYVQNFISKGIAMVAVPLFFLISGYLLFQNYDGSSAAYKQKLSRRIKTLLVPFLIWNFATYLVYLVGESLPATRVYFATKYWPPIQSFKPLDYANAFFGITTKYPMSYQFWFIRDLMVMVVMSPLIYLLVRRRTTAIPLLLIMLGVWMSGRWPFLWPADYSILFFVAGCFFATSDANLLALDRWTVPLGMCFGVLVLLEARTGARDIVSMWLILFGLPFVWGLTKWAVERPRLRSALESLAASSFFVYAAHEPLLSISRKVLFRLIKPERTAAQLTLYFLVPLSVIFFLVAIYSLLVRVLPRFMELITGAETKLSVVEAGSKLSV